MILSNLFEDIAASSNSAVPGPAEVALAMGYSLLLNLIIAAIYRGTYKGTRYSQDYVQTLIIIGVVTTILIMVVSGNGAIAFGMFAAFSVIRFRRTLGQSRDLAFVFFAMAIGMVVGARHYAMAAVIIGVVGLAIYLLSVTNAFAPRRASHLLTMRLTNDIDFEKALKPIFDRFTVGTQLVRVSSAQAGMMTELRYGIQLKEDASTPEFLEALQLASGNNRVVLAPTEKEFDS
ncbi:DUF4956 domain-containing protein [Haloferula sargassicola]|uniref:DUF4956 domain-containing protein n=1 Tax=Haloferula sargassicola TaxID=490096 RepID=A0ABP9UND1_9BACT